MAFWKSKKVFVTGAAGFIGSHLTEELVRQGADVTAFIRYNSRNSWGNLEFLEEPARKSIKIVAGDLRDLYLLKKSMKDHEYVFHLGASIAIPYSYVNPHDFVQTNVIGTTNVLTAALEAGVSRFVHTSTSEAYGTPDKIPIPETATLKAQSPYSASKISADKMAESFHLSYNLPVSILRPFNTYGPRQSARAVIPTVITQVMTQKTIKLGSKFPTRDLCFVLDTVNGFLKIAESKKTIGETINVGTGVHISVGDLANKILSIMGKDCSITYEESRKRPDNSEVLNLCADISKAKKLMDWTPKYDLDKGLKLTIDWFKSNMKNYKPNIYNL